MQRIKTVRFPVRNIGGDRAFCKLRYVSGQPFNIAATGVTNVQNQVMNVGAAAAGNLSNVSLSTIMGTTPNLSTMGALYMNYRIRGIKVRLTYWQTAGDPVMLFTNAAPDQSGLIDSDSGPTPAFVTPNVAVTPEQRWARTRVCQMTSAGGKPTTLSAYYSVNKVQGPDRVVKNSEAYVGNMIPTTPYWDNGSGSFSRPTRGSWMQFGITALSGSPVVNTVSGVLKVEQTVYVEFFGKRTQTQ